MNDTIKNVVDAALLWKIAIFRLTVHIAVVGGTSYLGAMGNQHWSELNSDDKFKLLLGISLGVLNTIAAFLDKTTAKLATGAITPPDIGDTVTIRKTSTKHVLDKPPEVTTSVESTTVTKAPEPKPNP